MTKPINQPNHDKDDSGGWSAYYEDFKCYE